MTHEMRFQIRGEGSETLEIDVYDIIGETWWGEGVSAKSVRKTLKSAPNAKTIKLRVNSRGGDVFDGFAIYNLLHEHTARVEADVDALAASMASVIIMAADEIRVAKNAMIMIHNPWTIALGEADDLRGTADLLDKIRGQIADAYVARSGLTRDRVIEMMDAETWMTADEAKTNGFADSVKPAHEGPAKAKAFASIGLRGFEHPPAVFAAAVADARASFAPRAEPRSVGAAQEDVASTTGRRRERAMTLEELRAQHPELYAAVVQAGVTQERDRVDAHLTMGQTSGDMAIAVEAIRSGASMTQTLTARYLAAGMNRSDRNTRQEESNKAAKVVDGVTTKTDDAPDQGDHVVAVLEQRFPKKKAG